MEIAKINDNYFIDSDGNIYSRPRNRVRGSVLEQRINPYGYLTVKLRENNKANVRMVHRLLAQAFIPNPEEKPEINHKDGNKLNNSLDNLEWVTPSENMKHAWSTGLRKARSNTGQRYIYFEKRTNSYRVVFTLQDGKKQRLKRSTTLNEAIRLRDESLKTIHS